MSGWEHQDRKKKNNFLFSGKKSTSFVFPPYVKLEAEGDLTEWRMKGMNLNRRDESESVITDFVITGFKNDPDHVTSLNRFK